MRTMDKIMITTKDKDILEGRNKTERKKKKINTRYMLLTLLVWRIGNNNVMRSSKWVGPLAVRMDHPLLSKPGFCRARERGTDYRIESSQCRIVSNRNVVTVMTAFMTLITAKFRRL